MMIDFWGGDGFSCISIDPDIPGVEKIECLKPRLRPRLLWFGGSSGDTVDKKYNARMATIAEEQQAMANEYYQYWQDVYQPYETAQVQANSSLIAGETRLAKATNLVNLLLLRGQAQSQQAEYDAQMAILPEQTDYLVQAMGDSERVRSAYYDEALNGVDIDARVNRAAADATQAFMNSSEQLSRNAARMGISPSSGAFAGYANQNSLDQAKLVANAKTQARTQAEQENFDRMTTAMGTTVAV